MIISARPYPDIKELFSQRIFSNANDMSFYPLGRDALLSSLITLGLKKDDGIIVPAYMCNSTIKPLQAYGFKLIFVDIGGSLDLPVDKIIKIIKKDNAIKALLAVHYFGLMQNMDKVVGVCQEYGVKVVEDASHGFMSQFLRDKDSAKGDAEIFSMRKSLPIVDGGALRMNNGSSVDVGRNSNNQCVPIISDAKYLILRFLEKVVTWLGVNIYGQFINNIKTKLRSETTHEIHDLNVEACQASWQLRKYLGNEEYLRNTQQKVVNNFNQLNQALRKIGFRLFIESVGGNVVPQACIVYDDKGGLVDYLRSKGIGAWRWPDEEIPREVVQNSSQYPNAVFFDERLVLIPIHQSITASHCNYMLKVLHKWNVNNS
jgi:perosamine synthetase